MYKKCFVLLLGVSLLFGLVACHQQERDKEVTVGIIDGPDTVEWRVAKDVAMKRYGLRIQLVMFSDYTLPNEALYHGEIDANAFQHVPYLQAQKTARGYKDLVPVAKTFLYPMAMYSQRIQQVSSIKAGDKIAVPNDPSNESRALLLLQKASLVQLKKGVGVNATVADIVSTRPQGLKILELPGAQLPRSLEDVTAAVINNDFAQPAGLNPKEALLVESRHSPYMNVIVVRQQDRNKPKIKNMISAFQSPEVRAAGLKVSGGNAVVGW